MKTKLFLDTNIVLDLLGQRVPQYEPIAKIMTLVDQGKINISISALTYTTVFYILSKYEKSEIVKHKLRKLKTISEITDIDESNIEKSLNSKFRDFEDAVQYQSALKFDCDIILTRNERDFRESGIPVMTAKEYLASINKR